MEPQYLKRRTNAAKKLFAPLEESDETEFLLEEEQEELIQMLRVSNDRANDSFKFVLMAFSVLEIATHLVFTTYIWIRKHWSNEPYMDNDPFDPSAAFHQSASPATATLFSLISFVIGMFMIKDTTRIAKDSLAVWTFVSIVPLVLMYGATEFSFELLWWSMPFLLQIVDLVSLWVMLEPDEAFFKLEESRYKLKGA